MPEYQEKLQPALHYSDPSTWCATFNNWEFMALREDVAAGEDFHLLNQTNWTKLKTAFGGGPEIPFFQYQADVVRQLPDGSTEVAKESKHDFSPIRVRVHVMKRTKQETGHPITLLVSKHLTHN